MVERQLRARGVRDERVLEAMRRVPREAFLPPHLAADAYDDCALPIDCGQTISQPVIVAMMTEALAACGRRAGAGDRNWLRISGGDPGRTGGGRL
jgi:protein-L-isoaspartate O-methyltransferase